MSVTMFGSKAANRAALAATTVAILLFASTIDAAPLGLAVGKPDITAPLTVSYDATTDKLTATEADIIFSLLGAGGSSTPFFGTYSLSASVDSAGALAPGGTLLILGDLGGGMTTLLAGTLTAFGFDRPAAGLGTFEFLLDITSTAVPGFGTLAGITIGSKIDVASWDFSSSFSTPGGLGSAAASDTFAVPEPGLLSLLALGAAAVTRRRFSRA